MMYASYAQQDPCKLEQVPLGPACRVHAMLSYKYTGTTEYDAVGYEYDAAVDLRHYGIKACSHDSSCGAGTSALFHAGYDAPNVTKPHIIS